MIIGNGESTFFWEDRWLDGRAISELAPNLTLLVPKCIRKKRTVREALVDRRWIRDIQGSLDPLALWQYIQIWGRIRTVQFSDAADTLCW
ncbi:hypothetical protein BRADI_3g29643v3, partial [Brachypodium distachyon]